MKKMFILLVVLLGLRLTAFSQKTNLVFYTEQGEEFYIVLNGVLQNLRPEANVKITDLISPSCKLKVIFADSLWSLPDKTLMLTQGTETTFNIKKNNKGEYFLKFMNEIPSDQVVASDVNQKVITFAASGPSAPSVVATTSVGVDQKNTSTSSTLPEVSQSTFVLTGYNGPYGCDRPISPEDFAAAKQLIFSKSFEDEKLSTAQQIFMSGCMLSSQVREILLLFSFEDSKIEFAKFAYGLTFDPGNYSKVNDAFSFESSVDEVNEYITSHKK